jgi:hypothetical protein
MGCAKPPMGVGSQRFTRPKCWCSIGLQRSSESLIDGGKRRDQDGRCQNGTFHFGALHFFNEAAVMTGHQSAPTYGGVILGWSQNRESRLYHSTTRSRNWVTRVGLGSKVSHSVVA